MIPGSKVRELEERHGKEESSKVFGPAGNPLTGLLNKTQNYPTLHPNE